MQLPLAVTAIAGLAAAILVYYLIPLARREAVFVPLPQETIDTILRMAEIRPGDVLYDLGSGTGRIIVTAAKKYGIKAVGIERDRVLAWLSKRVIRRNKLEDRVRILRADFFQQNLSEATVITVYLSQKMNDRLEPKLRKELKRGTRIVSADHTFNFTEKEKARTGYFWTHLYTNS